jgi:phosphosulfolactate phosphohydrolase-like enzyme
MIINILTIAIGFYLAMMAEMVTSVVLGSWVNKRARAQAAEAMKKFEQVMLMAQANLPDSDEAPVN